MKTLAFYLFAFFLFSTLTINAQVSISITGVAPDSSAMLDVQSTDKGILIPRMTTTQRDAITNPAIGLMVYDTDSSSFWFWSGSEWSEVGTTREWSLTGNSGTVNGTNFIGTTDNVALDFRINNFRTLRLQPGNNIIGGSSANSITSGAINATIAGGGEDSHPNLITKGGGTISGGRKNTVSGFFGTVPGGEYNTAAGTSSFAAGSNAWSLHNGTFVWADNSGTNFQSTNEKQFLIRATNGVGINKNNPSSALDVNGTVTATAFVGDGSGLTNLPATGWSLSGNEGGEDGLYFIGTTDSVAMDFRVNNQRSLRISPGATSPNITAGYSGNSIDDGVDGSVIAGGGTTSAQHNSITADFGVISGGIKNTVSGSLSTVSGGSFNTASGNLSVAAGGFNSTSSGICSTVGGGDSNTASGNYSSIVGGRNNQTSGDYSIAAGRRAKINAAHDGTFLFADQNNFDFNSASANEFAVRATGGARFVTAIDGSGNPTSIVSIAPSGYLGIGTVSPTSPLHIDTTLNNGTLVSLSNNGTNNSNALKITSGSLGTTDIVDIQNGAFVVEGNGKIGIGTTTPGFALDVNGDVRIQGGNPQAGAQLVSTDNSGHAEWVLPSDDYFFERIDTVYSFPNDDNYHTLFYIGAIELNEGDYLEINAQATGRIPSGSGADVFHLRLWVNACGGFIEEVLFQPDENANDHDNNVNITLFSGTQALWDCSAEVILEINNDGDDAYTIENPRMSVRRVK